MKTRPAATLIVSLILILTSCMPPHGLSDTSVSYQLSSHPGEPAQYRLHLAVSQSLYEYYVGKTHRMISNYDYAKFITPYALKPVADRLREIYSDDEDFANGVLMIVHQIPYEATSPSEYPVETIVENKGDCDLFSLIAASIMKAGGLDVVLLVYESAEHMNIGTRLSHEPTDARETAYYVEHNDVRYYMAECTGENWQSGWRVGECPASLEQASVQVITIDGYEQTALGQVAASYSSLASSTLSITVSSTTVMQHSIVTVSGQLSPALHEQNITVYAAASGSPWTAIGTAATNSDGQYAYAWNADIMGICAVRASWSGDDKYAGADSPIQTVTIMSAFFIGLIAMTVIVAILGLVIYVMAKTGRGGTASPQPPEIPT